MDVSPRSGSEALGETYQGETITRVGFNRGKRCVYAAGKVKRLQSV